MNSLASQIEAILFVASRPVTLKELELATKASQEEIREALKNITENRKNSGAVILEQRDSYLMATNPESVQIVKDFQNLEMREKLTDSSLETLAIITYKQPVSRAEIEAIRGVNSQYTLRSLLMRGLIERLPNEKDLRMHHYGTTHEFMQHLGIRNLSDLPDFEELTKSIVPPDTFASPPPSPEKDSENL